ncbi:hypothetical protein ACJX0J_010393, partial [Zea mays]
RWSIIQIAGACGLAFLRLLLSTTGNPSNSLFSAVLAYRNFFSRNCHNISRNIENKLLWLMRVVGVVPATGRSEY